MKPGTGWSIRFRCPRRRRLLRRGVDERIILSDPADARGIGTDLEPVFAAFQKPQFSSVVRGKSIWRGIERTLADERIGNADNDDSHHPLIVKRISETSGEQQTH